MAIKNANDGISIAQTAEGAMQEQTNILQRMRELAVQANNSSNSDQDRIALNTEFASMSDELTRIANSTQLNGKNLLNSSVTMSFQVGSNTGSENQITITLADLTATTLSVDKGSIAISGADSDIAANFSAAVNAIDSALQTINSTRAELVAAQTRLTSTINNLQNIN